MGLRKPKVMLDLNEGSRFGGPYRVATRISMSQLCNEYNFCFVRYGGKGVKAASFREFYKIYKQIKTQKPDLAHFSGLQVYGFILVLAARLARVPRILVTFRGTSWDARDFNFFKKIVVAGILEPATLALCNSFYCNSYFSHSRAISNLFFWKRCHYIYNYWSRDSSKSDAKNVVTRASFDFPEDSVVIVSVGRVTRDKGYSVFSEIVKCLNSIPNLVFLVAGGGAFLPELEQILSQHIYTGKVRLLGPRDDVADLLALSDIYLNPSLHETLSVSTLEAMAAGLPCVVSDTGGLKEVVLHGVTGFRCPVGDHRSFSSALRKLILSRKKCDSFGQNGFQRVNQEFSEARITARIASTYDRAMGG